MSSWEERHFRLNELALALAKETFSEETISEVKIYHGAGQYTLGTERLPKGCVQVVILRPLLPLDQDDDHEIEVTPEMIREGMDVLVDWRSEKISRSDIDREKVLIARMYRALRKLESQC